MPLDLPFDADALEPTTMLAQYLRADPDRLPVLTNIIALLDDDGRIGDHARYYTIRSGSRRAILRGVLIALAISLPSWLCETPAATSANRAFVSAHREHFKQYRRELHGA